MNRREFVLGFADYRAKPLLPAPDWLAHARASMRFLERSVDDDGIIHFWIRFHADRTELKHDHWDWSENTGRLLYGRMYARRVLSDTTRLDFEHRIARLLVGGIGQDGLHYYPDAVRCGRPAEAAARAGSAFFWDNRAVFEGLDLLCAAAPDPGLEKRLSRIVEALWSYAVPGPEKGQMYFAVDSFKPGYRPVPAERPLANLSTGGWILPLWSYAQRTGNERARDLAMQLAEFIVRHYDNRPRNSGPVLGVLNVHAALFTISGVASARREHLGWARKLYEHTRDHLASAYGWVAEFEQVGNPRSAVKMATEGCAIVDFINVAIRLARQGYPDCWDVIERFARNYLDQGQILDVSRVATTSAKAENPCTCNVATPDRVRGAFVGWGGPADIITEEAREPRALQNCCSCHYPYGLALLWDSMVTQERDGVHVNLLFSRKTPFCEVRSQLPGAGMVEATLSSPGDLWMRAPDWVDRRQIRVRLKGKTIEPEWEGRFVRVRGVGPDQPVRLEFELRRITLAEQFLGHDVRTTWLGDTVITVNPPGKLLPIFDRGTTPARA